MRTLAVLLATLLLLAGCTEEQGTNVDPELVDSVAAPEDGACRVLTPDGRDDGQQRDPDRRLHRAPHGADLRGRRPARASSPTRRTTTRQLGEFAYRTCGEQFQEYVGGDESLVMRSVVSWAWFRPSEKAWSDGARWYRCDIVGGGDRERRSSATSRRTPRGCSRAG